MIIRRLSIGLAGTALLILVAWIFRIEITLTAISIMSDQRTPVGEHQEVIWETGKVVSQKRSDKPNIVLIVADDLGWNDLTFNGGGVAQGTVPTPNIDSIAQSGINFTNGYAGQGTCAPSRAMMMTGRYGSRFGFEFTPTPAGCQQQSG